MIKVRIIYDVDGWAYARRARILQEYAPADIKITTGSISDRFAIEDFSILFDLNYGHILQVRAELARRHHQAILLTSFNNGYPNRMDYFKRATDNAHAVIVNNLDCWDKAGRIPGTYHISNGVDRRVFSCRVPMSERPKRMISIGSHYHHILKGHLTHLPVLANRIQTIAEAELKVYHPT